MQLVPILPTYGITSIQGFPLCLGLMYIICKVYIVCVYSKQLPNSHFLQLAVLKAVCVGAVVPPGPLEETPLSLQFLGMLYSLHKGVA